MTAVKPSSETFIRTRPQKSVESPDTTFIRSPVIRSPVVRSPVRRNDGSCEEPDTRTEIRQLVVWCPDWPVVAAAAQLGLSSELPLAVFERGEVFACSTMARVEGVRRGMRRRDASARCPGIDRSGAERCK
jgi:hypothetical protein